VRAAEDESLEVRQMALLALGEVASSEKRREGRELGVAGEGPDANIARVVESAYTDAAPALRFQSLIAANALGLASAGAALERAVTDHDPEVRHVALRLLEERALPQGAEGARAAPSDAVRSAARAALADPVLRVRVAAAVLLGGAGDRGGAPVLVEAVERGLLPPSRGLDRLDPEDEQAAIELTGELGVSAARPALMRRLQKRIFGRDRFLFDVRIALARLGEPRAVDEILKGLGARSRDDRTLAVVSAGRARLASAHAALLAMKDDDRRAEPEAVKDALALIEAPSESGGSGGSGKSELAGGGS
jgi:HEAT repeat protein